jgi:HSP20 family protein
MFELTLWKDQEMRKFRQDMDRLFDRMCNGFGFSALPREFVNLPRFHLSQTEDTVTLEVETPGVDPDDLEISVTADTLILKGRKREESRDESREEKWVKGRYDAFSRALRLPCKIKPDEVEASYGNQVLKIVMPKSRPEQPRDVRVKVRK